MKQKLREIIQRVKNNTITEIKLNVYDWCSLIDSDIEELAKVLKVNKTVTSITINSRRGISTRGIEALAMALENYGFIDSNRIMTVDLSSSKLGDTSMNKINDIGAVVLVRTLKRNNTITNINLSDNNLFDVHIQDLAEVLKVNTSITIINLSNNGINNKGIKALAEAIKVNKTIATIKLANNRIGYRGAEGPEALVEAIKLNKSVVEIDLTNSDCMGNSYVQAIMDKVNENRQYAEALIVSAKAGNLTEVQALVNQGVSVNYQDKEGNTALHHAVLNDHPEIVKFLLKQPHQRVLFNNNSELPKGIKPKVERRLIGLGGDLPVILMLFFISHLFYRKLVEGEEIPTNNIMYSVILTLISMFFQERPQVMLFNWWNRPSFKNPRLTNKEVSKVPSNDLKLIDEVKTKSVPKSDISLTDTNIVPSNANAATLSQNQHNEPIELDKDSFETGYESKSNKLSFNNSGLTNKEVFKMPSVEKPTPPVPIKLLNQLPKQPPKIIPSPPMEEHVAPITPLEKSWHFDDKTKLSNQSVTQNGYSLIPASSKDISKVIQFYQHHPVSGMDIKSVKVIYNPTLNRSFSLRMTLLQNRKESKAFAPTWHTETNALWRKEIDTLHKKMAQDYTDNDYPDVQLVPLWHGTKSEILDSLFKTGYANLATTDAGFFGKGIYSTHEAEYAYRVYSSGALIVNWVASFSAYPVIDGDMEKLAGGPSYKNYDTHFAPVVPRNPHNPYEVSYYPTKVKQKHTYTEVVVFDHAQCLPRYLVELQPSLPKSVPTMSNNPVSFFNSKNASTAMKPNNPQEKGNEKNNEKHLVM